MSAEKSQMRDEGAGEKREERASLSAKEASRNGEKRENIVITSQLPGRHSGEEGVKG